MTYQTRAQFKDTSIESEYGFLISIGTEGGYLSTRKKKIA